MVKIGDRVRLVAIPDGLPRNVDPGVLDTYGVLQRCLGRVFPVVGFNEYGFVELEVGEVNGRPPYMESIWVEPRCFTVVE